VLRRPLRTGCGDGATQPAELAQARTLHDEEIGTEAFVNGVDEPPAARAT